MPSLIDATNVWSLSPSSVVLALGLYDSALSDEVADLPTPSGPMRTYVFRPGGRRALPRRGALLGNLPGHRSDPQDGSPTGWTWLRRGGARGVPRGSNPHVRCCPTTPPGRSGATRIRPPRLLASFDADARAIARLSQQPTRLARATLGVFGMCPGRPPRLPRRHEPGSKGWRVLLRHRHPPRAASARAGATTRWTA